MKKFLLFISAFLIVFNVAAQSNRYWVNGPGDWQDTQHWSTTSGGSAGASIPTSSNNVTFDLNSNLKPGDKISLSSKAYSNNLKVLTPGISLKGKEQLSVSGSVVMAKNVSLKKFKGDILFNGTGNNSIDIPARLNSNLVFNNEKSNYKLSSNIKTKKDIAVYAGNIDTKGYDVETDNFIAETNGKKSINIENSKVVTSSWNFGQAKNTNLKADNSIISVANVEKDFVSGGHSYNLISTKAAKAVINVTATPTDALCSAGTDPLPTKLKENGSIFVTVDNPTIDYYITIRRNSDGAKQDEAYGNNLTFSVPPGVYTVRASDEGFESNFTSTGDITVGVPATFSATVDVQTDVLCYGGSDLELRVDATGGTTPYASYEWEETNFNPGTIFHTGQITPDLGEGYYVAHVTDANGCVVSNKFEYYPTAPGFDDYTTGPDQISVSSITTTPTCSNATSGEINIGSTSGGNMDLFTYPTTGYGYYITTNGAYNPVVGDFFDGNVISNRAAGTYFLWMIDGNNCIVKHHSTIDIAAEPAPEAFAGADATICANDSYTIADATASNNSGVAWVNLSTGHTGFSDPNALNPTYTPSLADIGFGTITLQLTAFGTGSCADSSITMDLTLQPLPTPSAGANGLVCGNAYFPSDASRTSPISSLKWTQFSGPGTASFSPTDVQLVPSISVNAYGTYVFQLEETLNGCSDTSHVQTTFVNPPTAGAGHAQICEGDTYEIIDATATNYTSLSWINLTTGDGTGFSDATALQPIYTPSAADIANGSVQLQLTATGNAPCSDAVVIITLTITPIPTVYAGADISTCGLSYNISDAASDGATFSWAVLTQPVGSIVTFNPDQNNLTPTVDVTEYGVYVFELTATNGGICSSSATIQVTYVDFPVANAGLDAAVCLGNNHPILDATATNSDTYAWTVNPPGSGTFDDASALNPTFTPTAGVGTYTLTLQASQSAGTCPPSFDEKELVVNPIPVANPGTDKLTCGLSFDLEGVRSIVGSTLVWSQIAGPGTSSFNPQGDPNARVTVSTFGTYTFQLEETATGCTNTNTVDITFIDAPTANAGADAAICAGETYNVSGTGTNYDIVEWITETGDGAFTDASTENTVYTPGPTDITNGSVTLKFITKQLSATCPNDTSSMVLTINALPIPSISGDFNACENEIVTYTTDAGNSNYLWSVVGGNIVGPINGQTVNVEWTTLGGNSISVNYENANGCTATAPTTTAVTVTPLPTITFTAEVTNACAGSTGNTYTTQAGQSNYTWLVAPDGIITNGGTATDNFVEVSWPVAGLKTVSVNYEDVAGCSAATPTVSNVTVIDGPTAFAGNDTTICFDGILDLSTATAANNDLGVSWINTTTNDGTGFDNANILNPVYTPSVTDQVNGSVELVLSANSSSCGNFTDTLVLNLAPELVASVGAPTPFFISASTEISVVIDGNHDKIGQLSFYLVAPDGTTEVKLYDHSTDGSGCIFPLNQTFDSLTFSSSSATPLDFCSFGFGADVNGVYASNEPWNDFYTMDPAQGGWTLKIIDKVTGGTGVLTRARISFTDINTTTLLSQTIIYDSKTVNIPIQEPTAIEIPTLFNVPIGLTTSCFGACDARAVVSVTGGTGPYVSYVWSDGQTGSTVDLCGGDYTVTVTDNLGCTTVASVSVQEPEPVTLAFDSANVACFGDTTGYVKVTATKGSSPYTYLWDDADASTTDSIGDLAAGTYSVTVTDAAGCPAIGSVTLTEPATALEVSNVLITPTDCGVSTGEIDLTITGGLPAVSGYSFEIDGSPAPVNPIPGLGVGTYLVSVSDSAGCSIDTTITMIDNSDMAITGFTEKTPVTCNGSTDGELVVNFTGGADDFDFDWSLASLGTISTDSILTNAIGDSVYTVIVTDVASNCSASSMYTMTQPDTLFLVKIDSTPALCAGSSDGTAEVSGLRGTAPYTYTWTNAAGDTVGTASTATTLPAGYVYINLKDATGCEINDSILITEPTPIAATLEIEPIGCGSALGSATITPTGGTPFAGPNPYQYLWTDAAATSDSTVTDLDLGKYYVTVTDANGCTYIDSVEIANAVPITLVTSSNPTSCPEDFSGDASVVASGGTGPFTYSWYRASDPSTVINTSPSIGGLDVDVYYIEVTDSIGCSNTDTVEIINDGDVNFTVIIDNHVSCVDTCNASAKITYVEGGGVQLFSPDYSVLWENGEVTDSVGNLCLGTTLVTVTDNLHGGCIRTKIVTITDEDALQINNFEVFNDISSSSQPCNGSAKAVVTGGLDKGSGFSYSYLWSTGETTDQITGLCEGWYYVTITDDNDNTCVINDSVQILQDTLRYTVDYNNPVSCYGGNDGSLSITAQGGWPGAYTYEWANQNWSSYPAPDSTGSSLSNLEAGWYYLSITSADGGTLVDSIEVTQPIPFVADYIIDSTRCDAPTGSITVNEVAITGGTAPFIYTWSHPLWPVDSVGTSISNLGVGYYTVTIDDAAGCTYIDSVQMVDSSAFEIDLIATPDRCYNTGLGQIASNPTGGSEPYTFAWSNGEITEDLTDLNAGIYSLTVTDFGNCIRTQQVEVTQPDSITFTLKDTVLNDCYQECVGSITVSNAKGGNAGAFTYELSNASGVVTTSPDSIFTNVCSDEYEIVVRDPLGCFSAPYEVNMYSSWPQIVIFEDDVSIDSASCNKFIKDGSINISNIYEGYFSDTSSTITPAQTVLGYNYQWIDYPGETNMSIDSVFAGVAALEVRMNGSFCPDTFYFNVPSKNAILIDSTYFFDNAMSSIYTCPGEVVQAMVQVTGAQSFEWTSASTILTDPTVPVIEVRPDSVDIYNIRVTSDVGCEDTASITGFVYLPQNTLDARVEDNTVFEGNIIELAANEIEILHHHAHDITVSNSFYWIDTLSSGNSEWITSTDTITPSVRPRNTTLYRVIDSILIVNPVYGNKTCVATDTVGVIVLPDFNPPTGYSPNGDGINDIWELPGVGGYENVDVQIFNRWGGLVWTFSGNYEGNEWDGTNQSGKTLPSGTYYFVIKYGDDTGDKTLSGPITILR